GIRDYKVTGVQTCALPISRRRTQGLRQSRWQGPQSALAADAPPRDRDPGRAAARPARARAAGQLRRRGLGRAGHRGRRGSLAERSEERRVGKGGRWAWWTV